MTSENDSNSGKRKSSEPRSEKPQDDAPERTDESTERGTGKDGWIRRPRLLFREAYLERGALPPRSKSVDTSTHAVVDASGDREVTAEHDTVTERSKRISKINRLLVDEGISCFAVWPLHRFDQNVERLGGIAWTLNAIGDCANPKSKDILMVVMRLSTKRYLAWIREGSHGLVSIFGVERERRFRELVESVHADANGG